VIYPTAAEMQERAKWGRGIPADRFATSYITEPNGCWRWIKGRTTSGYGHFHMLGHYYQAHLIAYIIHVGPLPDGLEADHLCRNRWCVNPEHVEPVTHAVNMQRSIRAVLSPEQVVAIRNARRGGAGVRKLARQYGINHATVSRIANGLTWPQAVPAVAA